MYTWRKQSEYRNNNIPARRLITHRSTVIKDKTDLKHDMDCFTATQNYMFSYKTSLLIHVLKHKNQSFHKRWQASYKHKSKWKEKKNKLTVTRSRTNNKAHQSHQRWEGKGRVDVNSTESPDWCKKQTVPQMLQPCAHPQHSLTQHKSTFTHKQCILCCDTHIHAHTHTHTHIHTHIHTHTNTHTHTHTHKHTLSLSLSLTHTYTHTHTHTHTHTVYTCRIHSLHWCNTTTTFFLIFSRTPGSTSMTTWLSTAGKFCSQATVAGNPFYTQHWQDTYNTISCWWMLSQCRFRVRNVDFQP